MPLSGGDPCKMLHFALKTATASGTGGVFSFKHAHWFKSAASEPVWLRTKGDYFKR